MTIRTSNWGEMAGIVALVISLIFVGAELRQSTRTAEAQALLDLNTEFNEMERMRIESPGLQEIISKSIESPEEISQLERMRLHSLFYITFNTNENAYMFYERGIITEEFYEAYSSGVCHFFLKYPLSYTMWQDGEFILQSKFVDYINQNCELSS